MTGTERNTRVVADRDWEGRCYSANPGLEFIWTSGGTYLKADT